MTVSRQIWVVIDPATDPAPLVGAAHQISPQTTALVIGPRQLAEQVSALGVAETRWVGQPPESIGVEGFAAAIAKLAEQEAPRAIVMAGSASTRLLAGRLAARLDTAAVTDVTGLRCVGDAILATHPLYGGAAARTEELLSLTSVLTVSGSAFAHLAAPLAQPGQVIVTSCAIEEPPTALIERRVQPRSTGELTSAKIVVGAGRGISHQEDLALIDELAASLGGQVACTRPLAEGLSWLPRDRYLGVSGLVIAPDLYLAVGISGQMQHMVGVDRARVIVAINNDKTAPIFSEADYAIVGDFHDVVPALIQALRPPS